MALLISNIMSSIAIETRVQSSNCGFSCKSLLRGLFKMCSCHGSSEVCLQFIIQDAELYRMMIHQVHSDNCSRYTAVMNCDTCRFIALRLIQDMQLLQIIILGIEINSDLTWKDHCKTICENASKKLNILATLKTLIDRKTLTTMYTSFVRP